MKRQNRERLERRAESALAGLYHNAELPLGGYDEIPPHVAEWHGIDDCDRYFWDWVHDRAESEIEYLRSGGVYGKDYRATLSADCNAGRYASEMARRYYVRKGMRAMRLERATCALWERITEYGELYQYGQGGATLAPNKLVRTRGGSRFAIYDDVSPEEYNAEALTDLVLILEAFNNYVSEVCKAFSETWADDLQELKAEYHGGIDRERTEAARAMESERPDMYAS